MPSSWPKLIDGEALYKAKAGSVARALTMISIRFFAGLRGSRRFSEPNVTKVSLPGPARPSGTGAGRDHQGSERMPVLVQRNAIQQGAAPRLAAKE
jgi:hypothetical protein